MADTLILIAERNSRWMDWARAWRMPQHVLVVLVPQREEAREDFCNRVQGHLDRLHDGDGRRDQIVFAAGTCWDGPALLVRAQMVRAILVRIARQAKPPRLLLDSGPNDGPGEMGMQAIADAVTECSVSPTQLRLVSVPSLAVLNAA